MKRLAVLISGNGSNLQAIIDRIEADDLDAEIAVVVSNRADAYGLERARAAGAPTEVLDLAAVEAAGGDRTSYDVELAGLIAGYQPDLIVLAGWMLILGSDFLKRFTPSIILCRPSRFVQVSPAISSEAIGTKIERESISGEVRPPILARAIDPSPEILRLAPILVYRVSPQYPNVGQAVPTGSLV